MIYPQLVDYIKNSLAKNIPLPEIKQSLVGKGWRSSDVDEAIALINPNQPAGMQPMQPGIKTNEPKKKIPLVFIFGAIGVLVFILIIGFVVYFVMTNSSNQISDDEILQGVSTPLGSGKELKFNINTEEHRIVVNSVNEDSADITIYSSPISKTFSIGQEEKFDFNSDEVYDLLVKLESITDEKANFYIQKITESICTEDWNCTEWTTCADSAQLRNCTDTNNCGTEESKPDETQECIAEISLSCSDKNGTVCEVYEECSETLEDDCCLGNCTRIPTIECGWNIGCLINESDTCHPANVTHNISSGNSSWTQITPYYYSIGGFEDETKEKCELYTKTKEVTGNFSETYWTTLQAAPYSYTDVQIDGMRTDILSGLTGQSGTCVFPTSDLEDYLTEVKDRNYELSSQELIDYECTGNLYE